MKQNMFLTDNEFEGIVGKEVIAAIEILSRFVSQECLKCNGQCCKDIGCGFYSSKFECCPIFEYRPAKCRFYFCRDILESDSLDTTARQILDTEVKHLSEIVNSEFLHLIFCDSTIKLGQKRWLTSLELEEKAYSIVEALETENLDRDLAKEQLTNLVLAYREQPTQ